MNNKRKILSVIIFFVILVIAISLRFTELDKGYNSDEGLMFSLAKASSNKLFATVIKKGDFPPLPYLLLHIWIKLGQSESEVWVRSYFVIFGIGVCILIYLIAKIYLNNVFGLVAFFIAATSPFLIWASQFMRSYIDSCFWALLSTFFMLKILKGDLHLKNKIGYVLSAVLGLYTFYYNVFIVISQAIYFIVVNYKEPKRIKKWLFLDVIMGVIFLPGILIAILQSRNFTAISPQYTAKGLQIFGLYIGQYARSIGALFGIDPEFLFMHSLAATIDRGILITVSILIFSITIMISLYFIKCLNNIQKKRELVLFFPVLAFLCIAIYGIMVEFFYFPPNVNKYLTWVHAIFIPAISAGIYYNRNRKLIISLLLSFILIIYVSRWKEARMPEFETKKAYSFILTHMGKDEVLVMVRNTNFYLDLSSIKKYIILKDYLDIDPKTGNYFKLNSYGLTKLGNIASSSKSIWFYRNYGNDELFGGNRLVMNWLEDNGYEVYQINKFHRIDIINYKKINF